METLLEKYLTPDNITFMLQAAGVSVVIAALALTFGLCLGILGAAGRISKNKVAHGIATFYVETIRGTPMMLQILFFYLGVPSIVRSITGTPFNPSVYLIGVVALSINSGAYTTELIRSAIQAVDAGQWEASRTLGLGYRQMMRFIILPQAFKRIIPPLVSEFITLIKDSSLLSTIGVVELLQSAKTIGTYTYNYVPPLLMASVVYLTLTLTISRFSSKLEERMALTQPEMPSSAPVLMSGSQYSRKCRFVKAENYSICQIPPLNGARSSASHPLAMGRGALSTQPAANSGRAQLPQPGFSPNPCTACVPVFRAHKSVSQPACNVKPSTPVLASCAVQAKLWGAYSAGCARQKAFSALL